MANRLLLSHSVGESLLHVINPVADQAIHFIIDKLGYKNLFASNIDVRTDERKWTKSNDKSNAGNLRVNRVRVKLNPNVDPSTIKWEASGTTIDLGNGNTLIQNRTGSAHAQRQPWADGMHYSKSKFSIMRDDEIAVDLTDHTVGCSMSMEVTMEFSDEHIANEALSRITQVFTNGEKINYIDIAYDVPIPAQIQNVMRYLFHLKSITPENQNGAFIEKDGKKIYNMRAWFDWMQKLSNKVITLNVNRNRPEHKELIINKNHFQALYLIECNQEAPAPIDPEGSSVTFNLTVQFARSDRIILEYPVIINNLYVDSKFVPMERKVRAAGPESMIMWDNPAVTGEWYRTYAHPWPPKPFMFPYWDPWIVPIDSRAWQHNYRPVLIAAFTLDDPDTRFDFDKDVAGVLGCKLDDEIIKCIHEKKNRVLGVDERVNITVFADDVMTDPKFLDISDGHTLIIKNRRKVPIYRMVVSIGPKIREYVHQWNRVWICSITTLREEYNKRKD